MTRFRKSLGGGDQGRRRCPLRVEGLESRRLLTATVLEYPIPDTSIQISDITTGPDGNLYFVYQGGERIGQFNPTTHAVTDIPVPVSGIGDPTLSTGLRVNGITPGADGNIWFTGETYVSSFAIVTGAFVGRYDTTTHAVDEFPLTSPGQTPGRITWGRDGNLYFLERGSTATTFTATLARINPTTHAIASFPIPDPAAFPSKGYDLAYDGITTGSDGNVWFGGSAHFSTGTINARFLGFAGRFNPTTNAFDSISLPDFQVSFLNIAPGPDGNLWYTDSNSSLVGQFNPQTEAVTTFPLPTNSRPGPIVSGPDGNLDFTESLFDGPTQTLNGQIGRINATTHAVTELPLPAGQVPHGITSGPGGNIRFTESTAFGDSAIGRVPTREAATFLTASPASSTAGGPVTFTATVTPALAGVPTGNVTFVIDGNPQPPVPLANTGGQFLATFTISTLGTGLHTVTARYSGDGTFDPVTSNAVTQTVTAPPWWSCRRW